MIREIIYIVFALIIAALAVAAITADAGASAAYPPPLATYDPYPAPIIPTLSETIIVLPRGDKMLFEPTDTPEPEPTATAQVMQVGRRKR